MSRNVGITETKLPDGNTVIANLTSKAIVIGLVINPEYKVVATVESVTKDPVGPVHVVRDGEEHAEPGDEIIVLPGMATNLYINRNDSPTTMAEELLSSAAEIDPLVEAHIRTKYPAVSATSPARKPGLSSTSSFPNL